MANNNLLAGVYAGLTNTYSYLASQYPNGLTLENLTEARTNSMSGAFLISRLIQRILAEPTMQMLFVLILSPARAVSDIS